MGTGKRGYCRVARLCDGTWQHMVLEVMNLKKLDVTSAHLRMTCFRRRAVALILSIPPWRGAEQFQRCRVGFQFPSFWYLVPVALGQVSSSRAAITFADETHR